MISTFGVIATILMSMTLVSSEVGTSPPNVIIIYTDDQGTVDVGAYGIDDLQTPHMDRLAREGVRFTQFYAPAPVCSPSRAGLLTGRYPIRAGVPGNVSSQPGKAGMPSAQVTIAEVFRNAGYATAHIGKWHLGYSEDTMPNAQGFEHSFGHMGGCIDNYSHFFYWNGPNRHDLFRNGREVFANGRFFPDLMVEEAERFFRAYADRPFLMYFALNTPHYPYQGDEKWLALYRDLDPKRKLYGAFLSTMDERIGRLLDALDATGLAQNTIVVFQSDHGHSREVRAHHGGGSAGRFRGAKFSMFEGGIRVPAMIRWPGHLPAGATRDQMAHGCDWLPTLAELCGVEVSSLELDGRSLKGVLFDGAAQTPHRTLHWQTGLGEKAPWAVREGDWKLLGYPKDPGRQESLTKNDDLFLVCLSEDPGEARNLRKEHPEKLRRLHALHQTWIEAVKSEGASGSK